ncbi:GNAT family N-acetyltransferase [Paenibacillus medicaginis]|uniref:GNAT family N-acetyltransferase n=1 Tax=Paenibacillus medicaginis TaxID=1470560 RepID=A0ABV5BVQ2_9BACL
MSIETASSDHFKIECRDIILCEYRTEDLAALYAITQQPEVLDYLPDWNVPKKQRLEWLMEYEIPENKEFLKTVAENGDIKELRLRLGILLKETGEFIGWCCTGIKDELPPPNREIMFALSNRHVNKGYTTQALRGLTHYLFGKTSVDVLNAVAEKRNTGSNRVIQKNGFHYVGEVQIEDHLLNHYKLTRSEWAAFQSSL